MAKPGPLTPDPVVVVQWKLSANVNIRVCKLGDKLTPCTVYVVATTIYQKKMGKRKVYYVRIVFCVSSHTQVERSLVDNLCGVVLCALSYTG